MSSNTSTLLALTPKLMLFLVCSMASTQELAKAKPKTGKVFYEAESPLLHKKMTGALKSGVVPKACRDVWPLFLKSLDYESLKIPKLLNRKCFEISKDFVVNQRLIEACFGDLNKKEVKDVCMEDI